MGPSENPVLSDDGLTYLPPANWFGTPAEAGGDTQDDVYESIIDQIDGVWQTWSAPFRYNGRAGVSRTLIHPESVDTMRPGELALPDMLSHTWCDPNPADNTSMRMRRSLACITNPGDYRLVFERGYTFRPVEVWADHEQTDTDHRSGSDWRPLRFRTGNFNPPHNFNYPSTVTDRGGVYEMRVADSFAVSGIPASTRLFNRYAENNIEGLHGADDVFEFTAEERTRLFQTDFINMRSHGHDDRSGILAFTPRGTIMDFDTEVATDTPPGRFRYLLPDREELTYYSRDQKAHFERRKEAIRTGLRAIFEEQGHQNGLGRGLTAPIALQEGECDYVRTKKRGYLGSKSDGLALGLVWLAGSLWEIWASDRFDFNIDTRLNFSYTKDGHLSYGVRQAYGARQNHILEYSINPNEQKHEVRYTLRF